MNRELKFKFLPHPTLRKKKSLKPPGSLDGEGGCSFYQFSQIGINKYTFLLVNCLKVQAWRLHSVIALFRVALRFSAFLYYIHVQEIGEVELGLKVSHPLATSTCETRAQHVPCGYPEFSSVHPVPQLGLVVQGGAHKIKSEEMSALLPSWTIPTLLSS